MVKNKMSDTSIISRVETLLSNSVHTIKIGYITLSVEEVEYDVSYEVYIVTEKHGKQFICDACSLDEAHAIAESEAQIIQKRIESRRKKSPTAKQLMTLFNMKIPIPVTLTFGEASDLIDNRITEKRNAKRAKLHLVKGGAS